jgi:hypothetical protein
VTAPTAAHELHSSPFPSPHAPFFFIGYITSNFFVAELRRDNEDFDANDLNNDDPKSDPDIPGTF